MQGGGELLQRQGAQQPREKRRGRRARAAPPPHHARHVRGRAGRPPHPPPRRMCGRVSRFLHSTGRPQCFRCGLPHRCCGARLSMLGGEAIAPDARDVAGWVRLSRCVRQQFPTHVEPVQQAEQCCVTRPGSTHAGPERPQLLLPSWSRATSPTHAGPPRMGRPAGAGVPEPELRTA